MISASAQALIVLILLAGMLLLFVVVGWWPISIARKQTIKLVKGMSKKGQKEIGGHPVEHWLKILNQGKPYPVRGVKKAVLTYQGHDYFFIDGYINSIGDYHRLPGIISQNVYCLVAVGGAAVRQLDEQEHIFHRVHGSEELAVFSIFRYEDFLDVLEEQLRLLGRKRKIVLFRQSKS